METSPFVQCRICLFRPEAEFMKNAKADVEKLSEKNSFFRLKTFEK